MSTALADYQRKRDFARTSEPAPVVGRRRVTGRSYVIQKHAASQLHFDLRLEIAGVLKSWAVPKGVPMGMGERHLAVEVEDHPLAYASFEGTIPAGSYGAGTVMVWDRGEYELLGGKPAEAWEAGKLHFRLRGEKLQGEWTLVRTRQVPGKNQWLLLKTGEDLPAMSLATDDRSVLSRREMAEIAAGVSLPPGKKDPAMPRSPRKVAVRAARKTLPEYIAPMKPVLVASLPADVRAWIYEIKFDGFRVIALKAGAEVELWSGSHKPLVFPDVAAAVAELPCAEAILDGEVVAIDAEGRSSFQLLQNSREKNAGVPICLYLFDLLSLDGKDLRKLGTEQRKARLAALLARATPDPRIRFSANLDGSPARIMEAVQRHGLEGVVAKSRSAAYHAGFRSPLWQKVKIVAEQDFVIGGYTAPEGSRRYFGALLLGCYRDGKLEYVARAGSGFSTEALAEHFRIFQPLKQSVCPFVNLPDARPHRWGEGLTAAKMKRCQWIEPTLVCRVRFAEWTDDGGLRHPVFLGLRDDRVARDIQRESSPE